MQLTSDATPVGCLNRLHEQLQISVCILLGCHRPKQKLVGKVLEYGGAIAA